MTNKEVFNLKVVMNRYIHGTVFGAILLQSRRVAGKMLIEGAKRPDRRCASCDFRVGMSALVLWNSHRESTKHLLQWKCTFLE